MCGLFKRITGKSGGAAIKHGKLFLSLEKYILYEVIGRAPLFRAQALVFFALFLVMEGRSYNNV